MKDENWIYTPLPQSKQPNGIKKRHIKGSFEPSIEKTPMYNEISRVTSEGVYYRFKASKQADPTIYIRTTLARERARGKILATPASILLLEIILWIIVSNWQILIANLVALVLLIICMPGLIRTFRLYALNSKKAWNGKDGQKEIHSYMYRLGEQWERNLIFIRYQDPEIRQSYCSAFYFDKELTEFDDNKLLNETELYDDHLVTISVKDNDEIRDICPYQSVYKAFWSEGLIVLRFKADFGPRDVCLDIRSMSQFELESLNHFILERLPIWCRKYRKRITWFREWGFRKHPVYDMWEKGRTALGERVFFKTVYQARVDDENRSLDEWKKRRKVERRNRKVNKGKIIGSIRNPYEDGMLLKKIYSYRSIHDKSKLAYLIVKNAENERDRGNCPIEEAFEYWLIKTDDDDNLEYVDTGISLEDPDIEALRRDYTETINRKEFDGFEYEGEEKFSIAEKIMSGIDENSIPLRPLNSYQN